MGKERLENDSKEMEINSRHYKQLCIFCNPGDDWENRLEYYFCLDREAAKKYYDNDELPVLDEIWFPDPRMIKNCHEAGEEEQTALCVGPMVTPESVKLAYRYGIFPWFSYRQEIPMWHAPMNRFVLHPGQIHISHSMRTLMNKQRYRVSINKAFPEVIEGCANVDGRSEHESAWLGEEIRTVFTSLWKEGKVFSVEVWDTDDRNRLIGGLYGFREGNVFIGESMFSRVPSASKLALIGLSRWMEATGGTLIDLQIETPHLKSMGGERMVYREFMKHLNPEAAEIIEKGEDMIEAMGDEARKLDLKPEDVEPLLIYAPLP